MPAQLSGALAGKRVRLSIVARSPRDTQFAIAYSIASGPTSGWLVFTPTRQFAAYTMDFTVPANATGAHYFAIWSDIAGRGAPLEVQSASITPIS